MKIDKENKTDAVVIATKNTLIIRDPRFSLRENGDNSFTTTILQVKTTLMCYSLKTKY